MSSNLPAVILLSGGLDSATCLAIARDEGFSAHTISFRYGQRHEYELERARRIADVLGAASHRIVEIDLAQFGGSALTDSGIDVPKSDSVDAIGDAIPVTYVPARNTVFLSLALAFAETIGSRDIFIGVTHSTTADIPTAAASTSRPTRRWPTWRPRPASKTNADCGFTPR